MAGEQLFLDGELYNVSELRPTLSFNSSRTMTWEYAVLLPRDNKTHTLSIMLNSLAREDGTLSFTGDGSDWKPQPETRRSNNEHNVTVQFCGMEPDLIATNQVYIGKQSVRWGDRVCLRDEDLKSDARMRAEDIVPYGDYGRFDKWYGVDVRYYEANRGAGAAIGGKDGYVNRVYYDNIDGINLRPDGLGTIEHWQGELGAGQVRLVDGEWSYRQLYGRLTVRPDADRHTLTLHLDDDNYTAESDRSNNNYTIEIYYNTYLGGVASSGGKGVIALEPAFDPDIYRYSSEYLANDVVNFTIAYETLAEGARMDFSTNDPGGYVPLYYQRSWTRPQLLVVGVNTLTLTVESEETEAQSVYTTEVVRLAEAGHDMLANLYVWEGRFEKDFASDVFNYTVSVGWEVESLSMTATPVFEGASVYSGGVQVTEATSVTLGEPPGAEEAFEVIVTCVAEDTVTSLDYVITVLRAAAPPSPPPSPRPPMLDTLPDSFDGRVTTVMMSIEGSSNASLGTSLAKSVDIYAKAAQQTPGSVVVYIALQCLTVDHCNELEAHLRCCADEEFGEIKWFDDYRPVEWIDLELASPPPYQNLASRDRDSEEDTSLTVGLVVITASVLFALIVMVGVRVYIKSLGLAEVVPTKAIVPSEDQSGLMAIVPAIADSPDDDQEEEEEEEVREGAALDIFSRGYLEWVEPGT
eukprot:gene4508-5524_t